MNKKFRSSEDYKLFLNMIDYLKNHPVSDLLYIVYESVAESDNSITTADIKKKIIEGIHNEIIATKTKDEFVDLVYTMIKKYKEDEDVLLDLNEFVKEISKCRNYGLTINITPRGYIG